MSVFLLDVNVLLALVDPRHVDHESAHKWFRSAGMRGWATCPITENGFVRIASNPRYPNSPGSTVIVRDILTRFCEHTGHVFWAEDITLRDVEIFPLDGAVTAAHLTDLYLLGIAIRHHGRLATFDRRIPMSGVKHGDKSLEIIPNR